MRTNRRRFLQAAAAGCATTTLGALGALAVPAAIPGFRGRVLRADDPGFDDWRHGMVWQLRKPDRVPALIARPVDAADVSAAMHYARKAGLRVSARSGGHQIWATAVRDGGLLLDLSRFRHIDIATGRGTARVGPSLWARDLHAHLAAAGYAFPVAHCATVPLGGFALGGGLGLNGDAWGGIASAGIIGGRMVTADGDIAVVSERDNTDLLWAMRGGGGGLPGVVTDIDIRTFALPAVVYSSTWVFPLAMLDDALELLEGMIDADPANTEMLALILHNPQAPPDAPPEMQKAIAVRAQVYEASPSAAAATLDTFAAIPAAARSAFSLPGHAETFEKLFVESMDWRRGFGFGRFAVENAWCDDLRAAVTDVARDFVDAPSWKSHIVVQPKLRRPGTGGAFSVIGDVYVGIYGVWDSPGDDGICIDWVRRVSATLDAHAVGHYVNEIDAAHAPQRLRRCYSETAWNRLRQVRADRDPDGVLHDFAGLS